MVPGAAGESALSGGAEWALRHAKDRPISASVCASVGSSTRTTGKDNMKRIFDDDVFS